jgi:hypothetical protein
LRWLGLDPQPAFDEAYYAPEHYELPAAASEYPHQPPVDAPATCHWSPEHANSVRLIGYVAADPEPRSLAGNQMVTTVRARPAEDTPWPALAAGSAY